MIYIIGRNSTGIQGYLLQGGQGVIVNEPSLKASHEFHMH